MFKDDLQNVTYFLKVLFGYTKQNLTADFFFKWISNGCRNTISVLIRWVQLCELETNS